MVATLPEEAEARAVEESKPAGKVRPSIAEMLRPDILVDGHLPEARMTVFDLSWQRYLKVDEVYGDDRNVPRLYYLDGALEIMSTSEEHERIKKRIADLMLLYFLARGLEAIARGQAAMRLPDRQVAVEPDESWCFGDEKQFPDLVLEIALTSGGVDKLTAYSRFEVSEVWIWRRRKLEVYALRLDKSSYERLESRSLLFPDLDMESLARCVLIPSLLEAARTFRAGLAAGR